MRKTTQTSLAGIAIGLIMSTSAFGGTTGPGTVGTAPGGASPVSPGTGAGSICPAGTTYNLLILGCGHEFDVCAMTARMNQLAYNPITRIWYNIFVDEMPKCNDEYAACAKHAANLCGVQNPDTKPPALPW
jgi:hypothetical protein